jgi:type II secretory pathway pseudopilin PulG
MMRTLITGTIRNPVAVRNSGGFSGVELLAAMIIVSILSAVAVAGYAHYEKKACRTVLEYDVKRFFEAETAFYGEQEAIAGHAGGVISNDPATRSTFWLDSFLPSQNTCITIVTKNPFVVTGRNRGLQLTFELDIVQGTITER